MSDNNIIAEDVVKFTGHIDDKSVGGFIGYISQLDMNKPLRLYFTTPGGEIHNGEILIDYINHLVSLGKKIVLVAAWEVSSMGLITLLQVKCEIELLNTFSILHIGTRQVDYRESLKEGSLESYNTRILKVANERMLKLYNESGITQEEIDSIKRGNDVLLDTDRLKELIKKKREADNASHK